MYGTGIDWGVPLSPVTLMVTARSIGHRLALHDGVPVQREILSLTLSVTDRLSATSALRP